MRVLQVVGSAEGGLRRHLVQLLRGLAGHRFVVAGPPAVLAGLDALPAVEALWPLPGGGGSWAPAGHGREPWADPGDGQSPPFDLVHVHGWRPAWAVFRKMAPSWPTVWTLHTRPPAGVLARLWLGRLFRAAEGRPLRVIAVSESLAREVAQLWPGGAARLQVVRNGLAREEMDALAQRRRREQAARLDWSAASEAQGEAPEGPAEHPVGPREPPIPIPILGYLGRLWAPKGVLDAVEVLARLVQAGWPAVLVVGGEGPHREAAVRLARNRGVAERLHLLGWQEPEPFFARIDLLLHPSRGEGGFPYTIMEAMAAGVPVVGYRLPAIDEVVARPGRPGGQELLHLVPPGDRAALSRRCALCLHQAERTARQAEAAAAFARETFSLERTLGAVEGIYRQVVREAAAVQGEPAPAGAGLAGPDQVRI
ncbi:glycosyltransferase family 4 protein [Limnochorda sp.]|uniref:glycosyltransferase family 4 protein n=1 Tax=Limnochorda sp. TaxID=1940279 RepID=UPI00396FD86F